LLRVDKRLVALREESPLPCATNGKAARQGNQALAKDISSAGGGGPAAGLIADSPDSHSSVAGSQARVWPLSIHAVVRKVAEEALRGSQALIDQFPRLKVIRLLKSAAQVRR